MIEAALFFATMVFAQYEVSNLNQNLHDTIPDYVEFKAVQSEIRARSGTRILFQSSMDVRDTARLLNDDTNQENDEDSVNTGWEDNNYIIDLSSLTEEELYIKKEELH